MNKLSKLMAILILLGSGLANAAARLRAEENLSEIMITHLKPTDDGSSRRVYRTINVPPGASSNHIRAKIAERFGKRPEDITSVLWKSRSLPFNDDPLDILDISNEGITVVFTS